MAISTCITTGMGRHATTFISLPTTDFALQALPNTIFYNVNNEITLQRETFFCEKSKNLHDIAPSLSKGKIHLFQSHKLIP